MEYLMQNRLFRIILQVEVDNCGGKYVGVLYVFPLLHMGTTKGWIPDAISPGDLERPSTTHTGQWSEQGRSSRSPL